MSSETAAEPIYYDSHMHTPLCKHAYGQPTAYARVGRRRGLKGVIVTCHSPMPDGFSASVRMAPDEFDHYVELVESAGEEMAGQIEVKLGLESDWFPGMEDWLRELHSRADFHYILGSVHPFLHEYKDEFYRGDPVEFQRGYFTNLAVAAETGLFDCLSHPDIVKVMVSTTWDFQKVAEAVADSLDRIKATGLAMELNTSGINKAYPEMNPGPEMLHMMAAREIPVVVSSDSHRPERVGADFNTALLMMEEAGYGQVSYFDKRERYDIPISAVRASLRRVEAG